MRRQLDFDRAPPKGPAKRVRREATAESQPIVPQEHACAECGLSFASIKRRNEHAKRVHAPAADRTCRHCQQVFSSAASLPRHVRICSQQPDIAIHCVVPASSIPPNPTAPHNKSRSGKKSYAAVERYLTCLVRFLEVGDFVYTNESRLDCLAPLTITSYKSFVRKFLEAILQGLIAGHGEGMLTHSVCTSSFLHFIITCF